MKFVNVGFNNMINAARVVAVVASDSAPAKRLMQDAKDSGRAIDCTCGRKTRCVVIMDSDHVILSALQNETVSARLNGENARGDEDGGEENE
ncbi:MAG: DUF370 domain-containing protein [Clostridia bacterium]|jgi:regulator of extracellular matrix RemA (YlzA/DUF370 family)|nr:DUF370 domain-containing protein [Clostridia bacterium]